MSMCRGGVCCDGAEPVGCVFGIQTTGRSNLAHVASGQRSRKRDPALERRACAEYSSSRSRHHQHGPHNRKAETETGRCFLVERLLQCSFS